MQSVTRIVSGGQTGADRAALDWAIANNVPHGGWCPKGRKSEDGPIAAQYGLQETPSASYLQRTEWNVRDSDGTAIFTLSSKLTGGSKRTAEFAAKHQKPWIHISEADGPAVGTKLAQFVSVNGIKILNVAGTRGSKEPGVGELVLQSLSGLKRATGPHPVEMLAMMGGPMSGEELDLASVPLKPYWQDVAVNSIIGCGLAKTREEAIKLLDEEI
jgi:hypothetical protein